MPSVQPKREEVGNGGSACELVVGGVQEPFDGLHTEVLAELGVQPGRGGPQRVQATTAQGASGAWATRSKAPTEPLPPLA